MLKKFSIILLMSLLLVSNTASAKYLIGLSTFPIQSDNFEEADCNRVIKMAKGVSHPAIAILYNTFGTNKTCLEKFYNTVEEQKKRPITEIHFSNEAGRRTGNVDKKDFLRNYNVKQYNKLLKEMPEWFQRRIKRRVRSIKKLVRPHRKKGYFILSTGLEDNYPKQAWYNLYYQIKRYWPYAIARSNVKHETWVAPENVWDERHAYFSSPKKPNRCILNGDGQDIDFLKQTGGKVSGYEPAKYKQVKKWLNRGIKNNCIMFLWTAKWQGIKENKRVSKPLDREFTYHKQDMPVIIHLVKGKSLNDTRVGIESIDKILSY